MKNLKHGLKNLLPVFLFLTIACSSLQAQDIHFSQFFEAPLLRNPSLAGIFTGDIRVQMVYRDQWISFTNAYKSGSLNFEYYQTILVDTGLTNVAHAEPTADQMIGVHTLYMMEQQLWGYGQAWITPTNVMGFVRSKF